MKKIILLVLLFIPCLIGCSEEDELDSLSGTTWVAVDKYTYQDKGKTLNCTDTYTVTFSESSFSMNYHWLEIDSSNKKSEGQETETGSYSYEAPDLTLTHRGATFTVQISGKKFAIKQNEGRDETLTFYKK